MTTRGRFAIVTPTRNRVGFLKEAIESVLSQDYPDVDYLVWDGGSTDETLDLLHSYGSRLRWVSQADNGQGDGIARAWSAMSGEYLAWLCDDDRYEPGCLSTAAEALAEAPEAPFVYGGAKIVDLSRPQDPPVIRWPRPFERHRDLVRFEGYATQPASFFRATAVARVGGLDPTLHYCIDFDLIMRLSLLGDGRRMDALLATVLLHEEAKTSSQGWRFAEEMIVTARKVLSHPLCPLEVQNRRRVLMSNAYVNAHNFCLMTDPPSRRLARRYLVAALSVSPLTMIRRVRDIVYWQRQAVRRGWRVTRAR